MLSCSIVTRGRRRQSLVVVASCLAVSTGLGCGKRAAETTESRPVTPIAYFWLRNATLLDRPQGAPTGTVRGPLLVELHAEGRVRSVLGGTVTIEGFLPSERLTTPADRSGLMLYAQRSTELHHSSPSGPVIGRLHPGAFVSVAPGGDDRWATIGVSRYGAAGEGAGPGLIAYAERSALGPEPRPLVAPELGGRVVLDQRLPLIAPGAAAPFTETLGGPLHVEAERPLLLAQSRQGIELRGTLDPTYGEVVGERRGWLGSRGRAVYRTRAGLVLVDGQDELDGIDVDVVPADFLPYEALPQEPLAEALLAQRPLYWTVLGRQGATCEAWKPAEIQRPAGSPRWLEGQLCRPRDPEDTCYSVRYGPEPLAAQRDPVLVLLGPHWRDGGTRCGTPYALVGRGDDVLYLAGTGRVWVPRLADGSEAIAFHPADWEQWFLTKDACESRRAAGWIRVADGADARRAGVHFDCYGESHR